MLGCRPGHETGPTPSSFWLLLALSLLAQAGSALAYADASPEAPVEVPEVANSLASLEARLETQVLGCFGCFFMGFLEGWLPSPRLLDSRCLAWLPFVVKACTD